jgi:hypothetical protein
VRRESAAGVEDIVVNEIDTEFRVTWFENVRAAEHSRTAGLPRAALASHLLPFTSH